MAESGRPACFVNIKVKKNGKVYCAKIDPNLSVMLNSPGCDLAVKQSVIDEVVRQNTVEDNNYNIQESDDENNCCQKEKDVNDENNNEKKDPKVPKLWNAEGEKMLIHIRLAKDLAFSSSKSHEVLWNDITKELNSNRIQVSLVHVINKFNALKKKYKEVIDCNKKTENDRVDWKYFDYFHEAYGHKVSTEPAFTMDTCKSINDKQGVTEIKETDTSVKKRKSTSSDKVIKVIKESNEKLLDQIKSQHDAKMTRMDRFLNIFEKFVLPKKD